MLPRMWVDSKKKPAPGLEGRGYGPSMICIEYKKLRRQKRNAKKALGSHCRRRTSYDDKEYHGWGLSWHTSKTGRGKRRGR